MYVLCIKLYAPTDKVRSVTVAILSHPLYEAEINSTADPKWAAISKAQSLVLKLNNWHRETIMPCSPYQCFDKLSEQQQF